MSLFNLKNDILFPEQPSKQFYFFLKISSIDICGSIESKECLLMVTIHLIGTLSPLPQPMIYLAMSNNNDFNLIVSTSRSCSSQ